MLRDDIIAARIVFAWQKNKKVERTAPGSKNKYKITYLDGQEKWTSDYPGDGRGSNRDKRLNERKQSRPSIKDATEKLGSAVKAFVDGGDAAGLNAAVDATIVHLGREVARETIGKVLQGEAEGKATEAHGIMRERVNEKLRKKQASSFTYGWMDEDGKFYRVAFGAHESFARRHLTPKELGNLGDLGDHEATKLLYDKGWVRVVPYDINTLSAETWKGKILNSTQLRELIDMAIENGMTSVRLDNGNTFRVVWLDENKMVASVRENTMNDRVSRIAGKIVASEVTNILISQIKQYLPQIKKAVNKAILLGMWNKFLVAADGNASVVLQFQDATEPKFIGAKVTYDAGSDTYIFRPFVELDNNGRFWGKPTADFYVEDFDDVEKMAWIFNRMMREYNAVQE